MKTKITVGVVCLARKTYDYEAALEIYRQTAERHRNMPGITWHFLSGPVIEQQDARRAADELAQKGLDGLAVIAGTFHLGHLALILKRRLDIPVLLWAFPELPYDGGKIRFNSVCGLNLDASNLYKAGYDDVSCHLGADIDPDWLAAVRMRAVLAKARVGLLGYRADGFFNLDIDEPAAYRKTGVLIDHYELAEVTGQTASEEEAAPFLAEIDACFDCGGITPDQKILVAGLCVRFEKFMRRRNLDAVAVRCWPEFADMYGCAPCAAMSVLQSRGVIMGCEGDVEAVMSMLVAASLGAGAPFLADLSQIFPEDDTALLWHCGVAPAVLWDGLSPRSLDTYFAAGRGVTAGFVLKSGPVSLVRIDTARGKTRLFCQEGEAMPMEKLLTGTYARVRFKKGARELLNLVTQNGVAHHLAMVYAQRPEAFRIFAKIMGFELME
jgi:L-fucose isomerase-like protein